MKRKKKLYPCCWGRSSEPLREQDVKSCQLLPSQVPLGAFNQSFSSCPTQNIMAKSSQTAHTKRFVILGGFLGGRDGEFHHL